MKKLFRMALVLALSASALVYTSCTKDYSPDISSLQDQIDALKSDTDGLGWVKSQLQNLQTELGNLKTADTNLDNKISNLNTQLTNAISSINTAIAAKADKATVEAELGNLKTEIEALAARLDAIDGEEGRLAEIEAAIEALNTASGAIDDLFGTYAKFIQSIAYVPASFMGILPVYSYVLTDEETVTEPLVVATFKITPPEARSRATMETSSLIAVQTKAAAAAPDTLTIKKLVYRDDAPGYVDVYAIISEDYFFDEDYYYYSLRSESDGPKEAAIAFAVEQVENTLKESVTSDYAPVVYAGEEDLLFQIYDAKASDIIEEVAFDDEVRVSPSSPSDSVCVFTADRFSVVADVAGAYLTPAEAMELFEVDDIALVSPVVGDTTYDYEGSTSYYAYEEKGFESTVHPNRPKTVVDCIVDDEPIFELGIRIENGHAAYGDPSGWAVGTYHAVPDTVKMTLTPQDVHEGTIDVIIPWDYKNYNDIKDTLIAKIHVDGNRENLIPATATETWNEDSNTDYTQGLGAVTKHTNDSQAIDAVLVSAAEYGKADSTYVYSIQKFDQTNATAYVGEFEYIVEARPADAVIELGPIEKAVSYEKPVTVEVKAITAAYNLHKDYYEPYPIDTVAADALTMGVRDSIAVYVDGKKIGGEELIKGGDFAYADGKETTNFQLSIDQPGEWKVYVYTHFANVGYTFVVTVNAIANPAQIAPKSTYVTVDNPENPKEYSVQVKGDVDTTGDKVSKWHYYLIDQPFQDYIKVIDWEVGSDSLVIDLQIASPDAAKDSVKADFTTPVGLSRLAADSLVANLADKATYMWNTWDSLEFKVAARLVPYVKQDALVDSAAIRLWTVDPIPVFDGGEGLVVEHEKDQLAKINVVAAINIVDFNGVKLNDENGLITTFGPNAKNEIIVNYDQKITVGDLELVSGADYLEELKLNFDKETGDLVLEQNQGVIVTPIVVRVPLTLEYMLDRGLNKTAYVYITFKEKGAAEETPAPAGE